jgi:uncharacterized protein (TIGR02996 family)
MTTRSDTDEAAFVAAIRDRPQDALPRLIFADWLEECGRADEAAWLRADVRLAQSYPDADRDDLRAVQNLRPPDGVPLLWLAYSLGDVVQTLGAMFLALGRFLGPFFSTFRAASPGERASRG